MLLSRERLILFWLFEIIIEARTTKINGAQDILHSPMKNVEKKNCTFQCPPDTALTNYTERPSELSIAKEVLLKKNRYISDELNKINVSETFGEQMEGVNNVKVTERQAKSFRKYRILSELDRRSNKNIARDRLKFGENGAVDDENLNFLNDKNRQRLIEIPIGPKNKRNSRFDVIPSSSNWVNENEFINNLAVPVPRGRDQAIREKNVEEYISYPTGDPSNDHSEAFHERRGSLSNYDDVLTRERRLKKLIQNGHPLLRPIGRSSRRMITVSPDIVSVESRINETTDSSLISAQSLPMHPRYESLRISDGVPQIAKVSLKSPDYYENFFRKPVQMTTQPTKSSDPRAATSASEHQFEFRYREDPINYHTINQRKFPQGPGKQGVRSFHSSGNDPAEQSAKLSSGLHEFNYNNQQSLNSPRNPQLTNRIDDSYVAHDRVLDVGFEPDLSYRQYDSSEYNDYHQKPVRLSRKEKFEAEIPPVRYRRVKYQDRHHAHPNVGDSRGSLHPFSKQGYENDVSGEQLNYDFYNRIHQQDTSPQRHSLAEDRNYHVSKHVGSMADNSHRKTLYSPQYDHYRKEPYPSLSDVFEQMSETRRKSTPRFYSPSSQVLANNNHFSNRQSSNLEASRREINSDFIQEENIYQDSSQTERIGIDRYAESFPGLRHKVKNLVRYKDRHYPVTDSFNNAEIPPVHRSSSVNHRSNLITGENNYEKIPVITSHKYIPASKYLQRDTTGDLYSYYDPDNTERVGYTGYQMSDGRYHHDSKSTSHNGPYPNHQITARRDIPDDYSRYTERSGLRDNFLRGVENYNPLAYSPSNSWHDFSNQILQDVRSHRMPSQSPHRDSKYNGNIHYQNSMPVKVVSAPPVDRIYRKPPYSERTTDLQRPSYTKANEIYSYNIDPITPNSNPNYSKVSDKSIYDSIHHVHSRPIHAHPQKQYQSNPRLPGRLPNYTSRETGEDKSAYMIGRYR